VGGRKSPFPITLAIGLYNSLYTTVQAVMTEGHRHCHRLVDRLRAIMEVSGFPALTGLYKILVRLANYSGGGKILIVDFDICILPKYIGEGGGENASGKGE